jgi:thiamine biosynthesis lipoprotein
MSQPPLHNTLNNWLQQLVPARPEEALVAGAERPIPAERLLLSISRMAMACEFEVLLNQHQYPQGAEHALAALDLVEQIEGKLSVYKTYSDLSLVNRFGAQRPITVSFDTVRLLQLASDMQAITEGAFDITAGSLSEAWGFSRRQGAMPTAEMVAEALQYVGNHWIHIDTLTSQIALRRAGVKTNPGGIGKGYALDRAAGLLNDRRLDDYLIHGGLSSVIARGDRHHPHVGGGWLVSLRHPLRLGEVLGTIRLRNRALGTSGSGKQFFHFGGRRYSHIIDPRSGWPAEGLLSATVICRSGAVADALATAFFVMGEEMARDFCSRHPEISAILLVDDQPPGRWRIETFNISEDQWRPSHRRTGLEADQAL